VSPEASDYNPVADKGTIEKASGILGRRKLRDSLPPVGHGYERVLVDRNGAIRSGAGSSTAGERYWASPVSWLQIDVSDHQLTYRFPYQVVDGTAGYDIEVTVTATVTDAAEAVRRKVQGVRMYIAPALSMRVGKALAPASYQARGNTVTTLNSGREQVARAVREELAPGSDFKIDGWLRVQMADVSVTFDTPTALHHDQLVDAARSAELDITQLHHKERSARAEIGLRKTWSQYLEPRLENPLTRAVETIAANPTQENIQQVVGQLDASDQWTRAEVVAILNKLIDKDFVGDINELQAIKVIVEGLQRTPSSTKSEIGSPVPDLAIEQFEVLESSEDAAAAAGAPDDTDRDWTG
jgi:hypothetical protein